jgi:hypothetical protein
VYAEDSVAAASIDNIVLVLYQSKPSSVHHPQQMVADLLAIQ